MSDEQQERLQRRLVEVGAMIDQLRLGRVDAAVQARIGQLTATRDAAELALAQLDAAEAQRQASAAQQALAAAENRSAKAAEDERASRDDAAFWSRRFYTSLAVGNGAGFVTIASALVQHAKLDLAVVIGFAPILYFAVGLTASGLIPWLIWRQRAVQPVSAWQRPLRIGLWFATTVSAGSFVLGLGSAAVEVWQVKPVAAQIAKAEARADAQAAANVLRPATQKPRQVQP